MIPLASVNTSAMRLSLAIFLIIFSLQLSAQDTTQQIVSGRKNSAAQINKPYVILISADGFRHDYATKYQAKNLLKLRKKGIKANSMIPSFPSVTFPNHYSIATGLYPSHHGIVYNTFYDRQRKETYTVGNRKAVEDGSWYGGTPIWVLAEQQQMVTASYFYVGSEAAIQQTAPTYWYKYNTKTSIDNRIKQVTDWLQLPEENRPHLITFYMSNTDDAGHHYGPDAPETAAAVTFVDDAIGKLTKQVDALGLPVNYIFVSDHGMTAVDTLTRIAIPSMIDTSLFIVRGGNTSFHLYAKDIASIQPTYQALKKKATNFDVYLKNETPTHWHFKSSDDYFNRIGDIFIVPKFQQVLSFADEKHSPGAHGFDPMEKDMHASFYAWGPQFKRRKTIASFENVHIYPLICSLLGLSYTHTIDGNLQVLQKLLR
jgi:predicted AlkP superfamily pyrophosphatase or phosphodiesterase